MPNIKKVALQSVKVKGLQVRTNNADEMHQETQKIAPLWGKFYRGITYTQRGCYGVWGVP